jgi:hypothetical protein
VAWDEKGDGVMEKRGGPAREGNDAWTEASPAPSRTRWTIAGILLGLGVAGWAGLAREQGGTSEGLGRAVETIAAGIHDASETVRDKLAAAQSSARNLGIEQQISARLHGDKTFDANRIEVHVEEEGTAVLRGLVPNDEAKERAVELTQDTKGVLKVVDHLAVIPKPRIISVPRAEPEQAEAIGAVPAIAVRPRPVR